MDHQQLTLQVYDELRRLAAAQLANERIDHFPEADHERT